jgi:hypothetical protein
MEIEVMKRTEETNARSGLWQQDMVQAVMPESSWPQSMRFSGAAGA